MLEVHVLYMHIHSRRNSFFINFLSIQAARMDVVELKKKISQMNPYDVVAVVKNGEVPNKESWEEEKCGLMYKLVLQKFAKVKF